MIDPSAPLILSPPLGISLPVAAGRRGDLQRLVYLEPPVFIFRKRAAPAVGEIKDRHVEHEHGVVSVRAWLKNLAQRTPEIVFALFGFHYDIFVCL
jgi:hypothetical protein